MTTARTVADYGAPKQNVDVVADPQKYVSAAEYGLLTNDVACMSATSVKAWVRFPTRTSNGACTPSAGGSHMGTGALQLPTVAHTATGVYTVTYPSSWTDNSAVLGGTGATETITFTDSRGDVVGSTAGHVQTSESGNVITVYVFDMAGSATDLGGGVTIRVEARGP